MLGTLSARHRRRNAQLQEAKNKDPDWVYVPSNKTDVTQTWKKYGWKPKGTSDRQ